MTDRDILHYIRKGLNEEINKAFDEEKEKALKRFGKELEKYRNKYIRNVLDNVFITSEFPPNENEIGCMKFDITIMNNRFWENNNG